LVALSLSGRGFESSIPERNLLSTITELRWLAPATIDLYKPTKLEMKRWGVRNVDIDILQWGSEEQSLKVLGPRAKHQTVRRMIAGLQKKGPSSRAGVASTSAQSSARPSAGRTLID